ncbi:hypothetical protein ACJX0J_007420, partial [Zea mays]
LLPLLLAQGRDITFLNIANWFMDMYRLVQIFVTGVVQISSIQDTTIGIHGFGTEEASWDLVGLGAEEFGELMSGIEVGLLARHIKYLFNFLALSFVHTLLPIFIKVLLIDSTWTLQFDLIWFHKI